MCPWVCPCGLPWTYSYWAQLTGPLNGPQSSRTNDPPPSPHGHQSVFQNGVAPTAAAPALQVSPQRQQRPTTRTHKVHQAPTVGALLALQAHHSTAALTPLAALVVGIDPTPSVRTCVPRRVTREHVACACGEGGRSGDAKASTDEQPPERWALSRAATGAGSLSQKVWGQCMT